MKIMIDQITTLLTKLINMEPKKSFIKRLLGAKTAEAPAPVVDPRIQKIMEGIAYAETRGVKSDPYTFRKPSGSVKMGDDIGKYQVTEGTLGTYGQKYLGKPVDANYFQNNPSAQEEYMRRFVEDTLSREYSATGGRYSSKRS